MLLKNNPEKRMLNTLDLKKLPIIESNLFSNKGSTELYKKLFNQGIMYYTPNLEETVQFNYKK